ncbi:macrolide family glycosyltransferase [Kutzneria buriramensis]|uniref:Demethyllactenocin mycarosyltransferase n=1 Tax=Kutzneria buriramensis TaxID=1045776 RepID=A0A3E0GZE3_9PSEU|nr:macrolide family glycosyltransferase [Kutzneria buriramensis]REH35715.1 demethyllactenocin mycarosyltransferase [Kutzneria buriramensis]
MAHVALCAIPFAGHINPTLGMVAELVRRGHRVSFPCTPAYRQRVVDAGAEPLDYVTTMAGSERAMGAFENPDRFTQADMNRITRMLLTEAVNVLPQWSARYHDDRPDLVVYDAPSCWAGRMLAHRWRVPAVRSHVTFAANGKWSLADGYADFDPADPEFASTIAGLGRLLGRLGIDRGGGEFLTGDDGTPAVVHLPRSFQFAGDTFGPQVCFAGPSAAHRPGGEPWRPVRPGGPLAFVSLGTVYNRHVAFFRSCVDALADESWRLVIALGGGLKPDELGPCPPSVEVHQFVRQRDVLAHADVFVHHGGMGGVLDGLEFGVPQVVVPRMAEHRATADRISELRLGVHVSAGDCDAGAIGRAVRQVIADPGTRAALAAMRRDVSVAGGAVAAADLVESAFPARR